MTKKDLFKIILKLYGLYSIIGFVVELPNVAFYMYYDSNNDLLWAFLLIPLVSILVVYTLLFQSDFVIKLFKLDEGFDNNTNVSLDGPTLIKIALVIIGVFMVINNLGDFISQVIFSFKESISTNSLDSLLETFNPNPVNYNIMISSALNIIFGFLLLTNYSRFANWIDGVNNKNVG
jgi:hypothetical protein